VICLSTWTGGRMGSSSLQSSTSPSLSSVVTPVKDQGECSSSWAYAAISSAEFQFALITGNLIPLLEQQVIDCSSDFGNEGCSGGGLMRSSRMSKLIPRSVQVDFMDVCRRAERSITIRDDDIIANNRF
jgi:hypothetical protein